MTKDELLIKVNQLEAKISELETSSKKQIETNSIESSLLFDALIQETNKSQIGAIEELQLSNIIDVEALQSMMNDFYNLTGMLGAVLDLSGKVLVAVGWQDICTKFHRCNKKTLKNCLESDTILTKNVPQGTFKEYRCKNNMWDIVTPIVVGEMHVGNVFMGQYFLKDEVPDIEVFREQAKIYGFDEKEYLAALEKVPRFSKEEVDSGMKFYSKLAELISTLSYSTIQQAKLISKHELSEKALKESEERFKLAMAASKDGIYDWNLETNHIYYSPGWKSMLGYKHHEIPNDFSVWEKLTDPNDVKRSWDMQLELINKQRDRFELEFKMKHKNGHWVDILSRAEAIFDKNGKAIRIIGTHVDITERKQAEIYVKKLSTAVQQSPSIIVIADTEGKLEYVNPKFTELTGYSNSEVIGRASNILKSGKQDKTFYNEMWKTVMSGKVWRGQFHNKKKNGELFWEAASISAILNDSGEIINFIKIGEDITQQKKIEQQLKVALEKALESDRLKSAFLSNMSHEIRTPMNGILGFINLLNAPNLNKTKISEYSAIINKSGQRLLNTINDIIDISKIEAGEMVITKSEVSINAEIEELYAFFLPEAEKKRLSLSIKTSNKIENLMVVTDGHKLHGVLTNLIKNAIKFTEKGEISIGYYLKENSVEFVIKDTGIGIPKNRLNSIFNRFEQADIEDVRVFEGSGLGLTISKAYITMLGGSIFTQSTEGKGSTFTFTIPYISKEKKEIAHVHTTSDYNNSIIKKLNLLIVEDDNVSSYFLETILNEEFQKIKIVENGIEAIKYCKENSEIDLILMDIKMPLMNGYDATIEIRKFNKEVLIIAQTAYAMPGDKEKAIKAGCNDYVIKPIKKDHLLKTIHTLIVK